MLSSRAIQLCASSCASRPWHPASTSRQNSFKITGVPGVRHFAQVVGVIHQQVQACAAGPAADAVHIPQVVLIHADQKIEPVVICGGHLGRAVWPSQAMPCSASLRRAGGYTGLPSSSRLVAAASAPESGVPARPGVPDPSSHIRPWGCGRYYLSKQKVFWSLHNNPF